MPRDSNGIWNVIRNVFSILYFCMKYTCVNKYIFDKSEIMNHHVYVFEWEGRASHGCRTCIERELIHHGNFSYFRSQKYEYKWIAKDQNPPIWGHISHSLGVCFCWEVVLDFRFWLWKCPNREWEKGHFSKWKLPFPHSIKTVFTFHTQQVHRSHASF